MPTVIARTFIVGEFCAEVSRDFLIRLEGVASPHLSHPRCAIPLFSFPSFRVVPAIPFPASPTLRTFYAVPLHNVVHAYLIIVFHENDIVGSLHHLWHLRSHGILAFISTVGIFIHLSRARSRICVRATSSNEQRDRHKGIIDIILFH